MELRFNRKICKSQDNRSTLITLPRAIAQAWQEYGTVNLVFDGDSLAIIPGDKAKQKQGDKP